MSGDATFGQDVGTKDSERTGAHASRRLDEHLLANREHLPTRRDE